MNSGRTVSYGNEIADLLLTICQCFFAFAKIPCKLIAFEDILTNRY